MNEVDISEIENALKTQDSPTELASYLTRLAAINSYRLEQLKKIQLIKPKIWLELKDETSAKPRTDKMVEMMWAFTDNGQAEIALTMELRRITILYRSISKRLSALETEFRMSKNL